jgi:hypothetical protein
MPKKIIDIEESTDDEQSDEGSEVDVLTKPVRKNPIIKKEKVYEKPKKVLSDKQKAVLEGARKKRTENIALSKQNKKIEAAKLLIEEGTNLKLKSTPEPIAQKKKSKTKTIIIESESESSSEEQIIIKKKHNKKKPKQIVQEESESEEEPQPKAIKQRNLKPQINESKLNKHSIFDGFC